MKRIGIITFHASHNYGSMLQAYALSVALKELGHDVEVINFRSLAQKMVYIKPHKYWDISNIKSRLLFPILFFRTLKKWKKYESFMKSEMPLSEEINYFEDIRRLILEKEYDAVITGSDQIWNINCTDFNIGYLLPFTIPCKKIAYAPSVGHLQLTNADLLFKSALSDYDFISVRESSSAEVLSDLLKKTVYTVPDATWLMPLEIYDRMSYDRPIVNGKYLFYYRPQLEYKESGKILEFSRMHGLKAVCSNTVSSFNPSFKNQNDAGPKEFLNLIKYANIVCGYSMHMIIFSLLFHKPFYVISENQDIRIKDLLKYFGLENRIVSSSNIMNEHNVKDIDWRKVDAKITELRTIAANYLLEAIKD